MNGPAPQPAQTYLQLRNRILDLNPDDLGITPSSEAPHVWGVIVEMGYEVGSATLVSLADGTTSLYFSTGGGMLGSGEYQPVAEASRALVTEAEFHLPKSSISKDIPLPGVNQVRFIFLTYTGLSTESGSMQDLTSNNHPLSPLFILAQDALTQLRLSSEKKRS